MKPFRFQQAIGILVLCLSGSVALAGPNWPVPRGASHEPVPYQYNPAYWQQVPGPFLEDAPACTLYSGVTYLLEADGTVETVCHEITRLNSRKAVEKLGEYHNIAYDPAYEKLTLNEARVIKADGRTVPVEPKHVQLRDTITDYLVYDHSKELVISFPTLETGDCIEIKWTTRGKNPEAQGRFFTRYTFGDDLYPVVCDEVRVQLPKAWPLHYAVTGGKLEPAIQEKSGLRTYHWRASNWPQIPLDENLPPKESLRLQLSLSTFSSWDDVWQWTRNLRKNCWTADPEIRQVVQNVTKDLQTPLEKARALTYWLRRHIRYVCVGEKHDYTPHPPALVFDNCYGDCKDTSQLLAVMLKEAGITASLVTLGVLDDGQVLPDVPSPWGTHAILKVNIDGKDHWIDTTASLAGWDQLPRDDRDRLCCVIDDLGLRLVRTPPLTSADHRIEQTTHLTIRADGSCQYDRTAVYYGLSALSRRNDWVEVPSGERRRLLTAELQDVHSRTRLGTFEIDPAKLQDYDQPVVAHMTFQVGDQFSEDPDHAGSMIGNVSDNTIWARLLAINLDYDRQAPLELPTAFQSDHRYLIEVPPGCGLESLPPEQTIVSKWGSFQVRRKVNGTDRRHLEITFQTRIDQVRVDPVDFDDFRSFVENTTHAYRTWLTYKSIPEKPAGPVKSRGAASVR